jgi:hypothetical protein
VASGGAVVQSSPRPDLVRVAFGGTTLSFSYRNLDSIQEAVANAREQFNVLDMDANGYLDRAEVVDRFRFERGLFDDIDRDSDDKIFDQEMADYVTARAAPKAQSCQINVYDIGQGFFQVLDTSADGRISVREQKLIERTLVQAAHDRGGRLTPGQTGRHYHIEFVRGSYQLFGRNDGMIAQRPEFTQRPSVGPGWFQGMDRNSDGDLMWSEFIFSRRMFDELDADNDGLIDAQEAERADAL